MLKEKYKPTMSDLMNRMQMSHSKLWYAATNNNWQLSEYEIEKIKEAMENVENFHEERYHSFKEAIDSVSNSVKKSNLEEFKTSFQFLTMQCNFCHKANEKQFNVITIPTAPPVSNQDFEKTSGCYTPIMPENK